MKHLTLLSFLCIGITTQAQNNFGYLDINQVKAGINSNGNLHYAPSGFNPSYEVPKGSGKHSDAFTNLWFGGMNNNQLYLAAQLMPMPGMDFNSGPLSVVNCTANSNAKFNKVWKLNKADINDFIANFANGNVQNGTYIPAPDLLSWPGNGDLTKNESSIIAPFVDVDYDNIYSPLLSGDYPLIKGDQALYFVYNDATTSPHASGGQTFGLEIHCMAYAYGTCSVVTSNPVLNYTTFYDYTIINRSYNTYSDFRIGLYSEADLGQYVDDYIGCDVKDNYGYIYNSDNDDETGGGANGYGANPPAAAFALLRSPESMTDGIDNDGDGAIDEAGEQIGMTNFSYFFTPFPGVPAAMQGPSVASEYYNYMHSLWKDGSPFTCNTANGYGGTHATPYLFPGVSYTNAACTGSWAETASPGDRRYIMSTKDASLMPGEVIRMEYAHVTSFPTSGSALTKLDQDVNAVKAFYQSGAANSCVATGIEEQSGANAFALYPNPASSQVTLTFEKALPADAMITISDVLGKALLTTDSGNQESVHIDLSAFASGIYFVKVSAGGKSTVKKIMRE
jgi:hypothetical protein